MKSKWKAALNQIWLAWTPVIALWGGVLGGWQPLPPFSAYIFVPVVLITATAGQLVLYTYEHEMVDWTDVIGTIEQLVIIGAITGAFAVGFYANAILTTKIFLCCHTWPGSRRNDLPSCLRDPFDQYRSRFNSVVLSRGLQMYSPLQLCADQ